MSIEWISKEYSLFLDEKEIGGMVYVGDTPPKGSSKELHYNSCIDTSLPIGMKRYKSEKVDWGEFTKYSELTPDERATYLDWLASSRDSKQCRSDFVRLYASGLEYRFFKDNSDEKEKLEIYEEVLRLSRRYGDRWVLKFLFSEFLNTAKVMICSENYSPKFNGYEADRSLAATIAVARDIAEGKPITAEGSLAWPNWILETRIGPRYYDCERELILLYMHLFGEKYPNGLRVKPPRNNLVDRYSANFGRFTTDVNFEVNGKPIPDISKLKEPVEIFQSIADIAKQSLLKLGRYRSRKRKYKNLLDEIALIPSSIRRKVKPEGLSDLKSWLGHNGTNGEFTIRHLYKELSYRVPKELSLSRYRAICDSLAIIGFGLTPDPRLASPIPKLNDKFLVFPIECSEDHTTGINVNLLAGIAEICIGVYIANAIGTIPPAITEALKIVIRRVKTRSKLEKKALSANLEWYSKNPPSVQDFKKFFKYADENHKNVIRQTVISIAYKTGATNAEVIARAEQVYKLLGLNSVTAYSDIHAGQIVDQTTAGQISAKAKPNTRIKSNANRGKRVQLNQRRVKALAKETNEVHALLTEVFKEEYLRITEDDKVENQTAQSTGSKCGSKKKKSLPIHRVFKGLEYTYIPLTLELLSKVRWTEKQVEKLASKHSLMWNGSLEVINEWSFELLGSELIEEYDGYQLNSEAVEKLTKQVQEFKL